MTAFYNFGYNVNWDDTFTESKTKNSGWGVIPELRFYPMGNGIKGFYVGPHIRFRHFDLNTTEKDLSNGNRAEYKANWNQIGGGVVVGGQWHFGDKVNFDIYGGPGFTSTSVTYEGTANASDFDSGRLGNGNFYFRTGVRLGYSF
jgi:hypothetical protein